MSPLDDPSNALISVVDPSLNDKEFRLLMLVACMSAEEPVSLSHAQVAFALNCSERQAIRVVVKLAEAGRLKIKKSWNRKNLYWLPSAQYGSAAPACQRCGNDGVRISKTGVCVRCIRKVSLQKKIAAYRVEHPGESIPMQFAGIKAFSSKSFQEALASVIESERTA